MNVRSFSSLLARARRHRFGAACAAVSVILAIASAALLKYHHSLSGIHRKKQAEGEAVVATLRSAPQLRDELAFARETNSRIESNLASESNLEGNVEYFYRMEEQTKAHLDEVRALSQMASGDPNYRRLPFSLRASGSYGQLAGLIHAIETGPRLVNVTQFGMRRRGATSSLVTLEISLDLLGKK